MGRNPQFKEPFIDLAATGHIGTSHCIASWFIPYKSEAMAEKAAEALKKIKVGGLTCEMARSQGQSHMSDYQEWHVLGNHKGGNLIGGIDYLSPEILKIQ